MIPACGVNSPGTERPAAVEREEERQAVHEMRRDGAREGAALALRLADEPDVAETQVAQAAVDQLRRRARGARAEVAGVDERDGEPLARGMGRRRGPDHAAADHEEVERAPLEGLACRRPLLAHAGHTGFVQARRPV